MRLKPPLKVVRGPNVDVAIAQLKKIYLPHCRDSLPTLLTARRPKALGRRAELREAGLPPEAEGVGWRRTQSAANPSLPKFPDNPRFTGKKRKKTGNRRLRVGYSHTLSIIYERIPYAVEQGILDNEQGMRTREQGMHLLV